MNTVNIGVNITNTNPPTQNELNKEEEIHVSVVVRPARIEHDIVPTGTVVRVDSNPIARYAYATGVFAEPINQI